MHHQLGDALWQPHPVLAGDLTGFAILIGNQKGANPVARDRTRMTRIERVYADKNKKISGNLYDLYDPRSIGLHATQVRPVYPLCLTRI